MFIFFAFVVSGLNYLFVVGTIGGNASVKDMKSYGIGLYLNADGSMLYNVGDTAELNCPEDVLRSVTVWVKVDQDQNIMPVSHVLSDRITWTYHEQSKLSTLKIRNVSDWDMGNYRCYRTDLNGYSYLNSYVENRNRTYNSKLTQLVNVTLRVLTIPKITVKPAEHIVADIGSEVEFNCQTSGYPAPFVYWKIEGRLLPNGLQINPGKIFTLPSVTEEDEGEYQCVAYNGLGTVSQTVTLEIT